MSDGTLIPPAPPQSRAAARALLPWGLRRDCLAEGLKLGNIFGFQSVVCFGGVSHIGVGNREFFLPILAFFPSRQGHLHFEEPLSEQRKNCWESTHIASLCEPRCRLSCPSMYNQELPLPFIWAFSLEISQFLFAFVWGTLLEKGNSCKTVPSLWTSLFSFVVWPFEFEIYNLPGISVAWLEYSIYCISCVCLTEGSSLIGL